MRRNAFTLIEMLIVITIIGILAGLSLAVISGVQKSQRRIKTTTLMTGVQATLDSYKTTYGYYPGSKSEATTTNPNASDHKFYRIAATTDPELILKILRNNALELEETIKQFSPGSLTAKGLTDGVGNRLFYLESRSYPDNPPEQPRMDSYQLWSMGENSRNDPSTTYPGLPWGGGDDVTIWK
jgi:prepilin-type N-terminal cleavage/methylation domain-containing protein